MLGVLLEPEPEGHGDIEDSSGVPVGKVISNLQSLVVPWRELKYWWLSCIQIMNDGQMMRHIRIFLIFVANTDRNENNHCRIRVSF